MPSGNTAGPSRVPRAESTTSWPVMASADGFAIQDVPLEDGEAGVLRRDGFRMPDKRRDQVALRQCLGHQLLTGTASCTENR